ncbi:MAG: DUF6055 domain-containing protein [Armatimonadetes bacterium]|nr:DUF6055 domain-containing protein [Armatimonadota bacterium]
MKNGFMMMVVGTMLMLACINALASDDLQISNKFDLASVQRIEIGGKLLVDLHAEIMLAVDKNQKVNNWFNAGYLWGDFGDFGFAGPKAKYPSLTTVDGVKAVTFTGGQLLKGSPLVEDKDITDGIRGNLLAPASMIGAGEYAVEVWAYNPSFEPNETLISWGDGSLIYPEAKFAPVKKWHHIVVIHSGDENKLYVDGKLQTTYKGGGSARAGFVLGSATDGKNAFTGSIAVVRVHEKALSEDQIAKNFNGGVELGTTFIPNFDPATPDDVNWGNSDNPKYKQLFSKHFRMMWDPIKDINKIMTDQRTHEMLAEYEEVYNLYEQMGMAAPIVTANKKDRGDGIKYKINIAIGWDNGAWGGYNGARGCGYPIHGPGVVHAHELGHAYQSQQMGGLAGNWWETHTSWLSKMFENRNTRFNYNNAMVNNAMFFVSNGRDYYHCYHIFEQLGLDPELGPMFVAKLWNTNGWDAYPFIRGEQLFPDKANLLKDQWVKMGRRQITWDYPDAVKNPIMDDCRMSRTLLEPIPYQPGVYRCPKDMAPQQFGYVICPLEAKAKSVTVDLDGYIDKERGSEWRACLVAVDSKNEARYGDIFAKGKSSMTLTADEKDLYLVVAATPTTMMIDMAGDGPKADYRCFEQSQFPFTVKLDGCSPKDIWIPAKPYVLGKAHSNGGGFVAETAKVDATAYVGPSAQVLDNAQVLGNARIEDYAVVKDNATVRDNAVLSGHALASGSAMVKGYAKVRDFGSTTSVVADFAKVAEHAVNGGKMTEYATAKGCAGTFGNNYGTSIVDGMYAKGNEVSKGIWLTWSWGQGKNAGELDEDLGGVYAQYLFDKKHAYLAWDTKGVTHGYLVGNPKVDGGIFTLNGKDQFVEMPKDAADMRDITLVFKVNWNGGKGQYLWSGASDAKNRIYLTPANADGVMAFGIIKDGKDQAIKAKSPLPTGKMAEVKVILSDDTGTLYLDGQLVGQNDKFTANPEDIKSTVCYLGRDMNGGYFNGQIDEVTIYSIATIDKAAPYPNPAQWRVVPTAYSDSSVTMYAQVGCDPKPGVEYMFTETTGKGHSSKWQSSPVYEDTGLKADETCKYTVKMRDAAGNETKPSPEKSASFQKSTYFVADKTPDGAPLFVMEAEHFQNNIKGSFHDWIPCDLLAGYRGEGAMYSAPEDGPAVGDFMLDAPRMDYRFKVDQPGTYYLWTRGIGRWWMSNSIYFAVDGNLPQKAYYGWVNLTYRWQHSSNMDSNKPLEPIQIDSSGVHTLSVWMCEDGGQVDSFILTTANYDEFKPTDELDLNKDLVGKGTMPESRVEKDGQLVQVVKSIEKPEWSSLQPIVLNGNRIAMQAKDYSDKLGSVEYQFEVGGKSSAWQKDPYFEVKGIAAIAASACRYKVRSVGKETDWSDTVKTNWDISKGYIEPADGVTVIEAEHFANNTAASDGHKWAFVRGTPDGKVSGEGYMEANKKDGSPFLGKTLDSKARMDYQINFTKTGAHWVWVRGYGIYRFNHTIFVGLDMNSGDWGKIEMGWEGMSWIRSKPYDVAAPGVQTLSVWLNHDALVVDKIIVTSDENYRPSKEADSSDGSPTGIGPDETNFGK